MRPSDATAFQETISKCHAFYGKTVTDATLDVWWMALRGYDLTAIQEALGRHLVNPDSGQFVPKPADVVKMMQGSTQDSALDAWSKVQRAIRAVGTYSTVVFDDPLIHRVVEDMGGWPALGVVLEKELPFKAKEFENRYRGYKQRSMVPEHPRKLIGIFDRDNATNGHAEQEPVLIGNPTRAQAVLEGTVRKQLEAA